MEFDDQVQIAALSETEAESDLTDLAELEESINLATPSPRRLRSKGDKSVISSQGSQDGERKAGGDVDLGRRVTPMRKAKRNVGSLKEDDTEEEEEDQLVESDAEDAVEERSQLVDSPTPKPNRTRRTPLRHRLRPRRTQDEAPSDGDDEGSEDESVAVDQSVDGEEDDEQEEEQEEEQDMDDGETIKDESDEEDVEDVEVEEAEEEEEPVPEHCVLRNGKVVGEGEVDEDEVLTEEMSEEDAEGEEVEEEIEEADERDETPEQDAASIDLENEEDDEDLEDGEEVDEAMDDDSEFAPCSSQASLHLTYFSRPHRRYRQVIGTVTP